MSVPPALPLERLFAPGIRLGWTFRDHRVPAAPYVEPQPDPDTLPKQMTERASITQSRYAVARRWVIKPSLVAAAPDQETGIQARVPPAQPTGHT